MRAYLLMLMPMSCQLPSVVTSKKNVTLIRSLSAMKTRYAGNGGVARSFSKHRNATATVIMGTRTFSINSAPMRNGLNRVVNRYTDEISNDATLAMLPVPKNAALMSARNVAACRATLLSASRSALDVANVTATSAFDSATRDPRRVLSPSNSASAAASFWTCRSSTSHARDAKPSAA
jgi:hypothetical protein